MNRHPCGGIDQTRQTPCNRSSGATHRFRHHQRQVG
nr:MAG TPA: hypothetical protein [Caudoviricetes sp.]